jgi:hypothetical protein
MHSTAVFVVEDGADALFYVHGDAETDNTGCAIGIEIAVEKCIEVVEEGSSVLGCNSNKKEVVINVRLTRTRTFRFHGG